MPLREGGLGLRAQASLREAAYLGSWLGNLEGVRARCPEGTASQERFLHEDRDWARALANAQAALGQVLKLVGSGRREQGGEIAQPRLALGQGGRNFRTGSLLRCAAKRIDW